MNHTMRLPLLASLVLVSLSLSVPAQAQQATMTFFITSAGLGKGADLGGLEGADRHCQSLAQAAGADGRAFPPGEDRTCSNWTKSTQGAAMVGHHDRTGLNEEPPAKSWNSSHPSRGPDGGCSQADLRSTGGDGLFYCFASN